MLKNKTTYTFYGIQFMNASSEDIQWIHLVNTHTGRCSTIYGPLNPAKESTFHGVIQSEISKTRSKFLVWRSLKRFEMIHRAAPLIRDDLIQFSCGAGAKPPPSARPSDRAEWGSSSSTAVSGIAYRQLAFVRLRINAVFGNCNRVSSNREDLV